MVIQFPIILGQCPFYYENLNKSFRHFVVKIIKLIMQNWLSFTSSKKLLLLLIFLQLIAIIISLYNCGGGGGSSSSSNSNGGGSSSSATLTWDAPTTNADGTPLTDLGGYKIYYGTSSGNYSVVIDVGNVTTYKIEGLSPGIYYFAVTAYDTSGNESEYSNEVSKKIE
ncbi:MAG: fibronectin type III domain-containing protein [Nitrospirota bacterium]